MPGHFSLVRIPKPNPSWRTSALNVEKLNWPLRVAEGNLEAQIEHSLCCAGRYIVVRFRFFLESFLDSTQFSFYDGCQIKVNPFWAAAAHGWGWECKQIDNRIINIVKKVMLSRIQVAEVQLGILKFIVTEEMIKLTTVIALTQHFKFPCLNFFICLYGTLCSLVPF